MSDSDATPDPIDKVYAQAEATLSDEGARTMRRARVLAAIAAETQVRDAANRRPDREPAGRRGGWLVAACVAGLSVFVALGVYRTDPFRQPVTAPSPPTAAPAAVAPPTYAAGSPAPAPPQSSRKRAVASSPPRADVERRPRSPEPTPAPPTPPSPGAQEVVVTGSRREVEAAPTPPPHASTEIEELVVTQGRAPADATAEARSAPADRVARLHAAAAAGRTAELRALLARGVPVDAPDEEGETALMKSIQGDHPAAAALLRRRGASLDVQNHAGVSARDMALSVGDAKLNQALGLSN